MESEKLPLTIDQQIQNSERELARLKGKGRLSEQEKIRMEYLKFEIGMMKDERAFFGSDEWGIDLRPIVAEEINPPKDISQLSDSEVTNYLYRILELLARYHLLVEGTDHLTDRELYKKIMKEVLPQPLGITAPGIGSVIHHDVSYVEDMDEFDLPEAVSNRDKELRKLVEKYRKKAIPS